MKTYKQTQNPAQNKRSGELVLEAMIVVVIVMLVLLIVLSTSFFLYQRVGLQIVAQDTAVKMAQTYRFENSDYLIGFVKPDDVTAVDPYRYMWSSDSKKDFLARTTEKCGNFAQYRLSKHALLGLEQPSETTVNVVEDTMGRRHLEVTVKALYRVPFFGMLRMLGVQAPELEGDVYTMTATAYADSPDVVDYVGTVNYIKSTASLRILNGKTKGMIDKIIKTVSSVREHKIELQKNEEAENP